MEPWLIEHLAHAFFLHDSTEVEDGDPAASDCQIMGNQEVCNVA